jgi:C4-dicarboxylate-specific signal transduction histidine kinase
MNFHETMGYVAGGLQFIVAGYALRLNRLFGTSRVGWSLFGAFSLLALLHLIQSLMPSNDGEQVGVKIEVMYSLISLLLLTGMTHIETLLKERLRLEQTEQHLRAELESQVKEKTAHLTKAIEELKLEIDQRKRMEVEVEKTHKELVAASRQAGIAEIAIKVLHSVGNMLQSVNVSASLVFDQVKQSKIANVVRVGALIRDHAADLGNFMKHDRRGQKLPEYIAQLAEHLSNEQTILSNELASLRKNIQEILTIQRSYIKISDVTNMANGAAPVEDAPHVNGDTPARHDTPNPPLEGSPSGSCRQATIQF